MSNIRLSEKHGVNPSLEQCFVCMKDVGVVLFGKLKGDAEAPGRVCLGPNSEPCDECKGFMEQGVILISVRKGESGNNPYRTGGWCVVKDEAITRWGMSPELEESILKRRMAFIDDETWNMIGLPREHEPPP